MNVLKNINSIIIAKWIIIFFAYDFLSRILIYFDITKALFYYAIIFKCLVVSTCILEIFLKKTIKTKLLFQCGFFLILIFILNQLFIYEHLTIPNFKHNLYYILNCTIPLFFVIIYRNEKEKSKKILTLFLGFLTINSIIIIIAFFFNLDVFRSYFQTPNTRFGYSGMLLYHWEVGYLYFIGAFVSYYLLKSIIKKKFKYTTALFVFTLFIVGTKKAFFLAIFFIIYVLLKEHRYFWSLFKKRPILSVTSSVLIGKFTFHYFIRSNWVMFYNLYKNEGFWSSFLSYRNESILKMVTFLEYKWSIINILIGGPFMDDFKTELELLDIFVLFGLAGLIIYFWLLKNVINTDDTLIFTVMLLIAAIFSGNFFSSINVVTLYFISVFFMAGNKTKKVYSLKSQLDEA